MRIIEIHAPRNGGTCFFARASDSSGRRFYFDITPEGEAVGVFREEKNKFGGESGMELFRQVKPSPAVRKLAREAIRKATA